MPYKNLTATVTSRCPGVRVAGNNVSIDVDYLVYGRYIGYLFDIEYNINYDDFPDRSSMSYATINLEYTGGPRENYCYLKIRKYGNIGDGSTTNIDFTTGYEDSFYVDTNKEGRNTCSIFFSMAENEHLFRTFKGSVYSFNVKNIEQSYNCLLYTSPSPRDVEESRMPSSA